MAWRNRFKQNNNRLFISDTLWRQCFSGLCCFTGLTHLQFKYEVSKWFQEQLMFEMMFIRGWWCFIVAVKSLASTSDNSSQHQRVSNTVSLGVTRDHEMKVSFLDHISSPPLREGLKKLFNGIWQKKDFQLKNMCFFFFKSSSICGLVSNEIYICPLGGNP